MCRTSYADQIRKNQIGLVYRLEYGPVIEVRFLSICFYISSIKLLHQPYYLPAYLYKFNYWCKSELRVCILSRTNRLTNRNLYKRFESPMLSTIRIRIIVIYLYKCLLYFSPCSCALSRIITNSKKWWVLCSLSGIWRCFWSRLHKLRFEVISFILFIGGFTMFF